LKFDAYELIAVIIPGALPTLAASLLIPEIAWVLGKEGVELGEFGIFLIISFVIGHVVQVLGNWIENLEDLLGVGRSSLPFNAARRPVSSDQWDRFLNGYLDDVGGEKPVVTKGNWFAVAKEVYSRLSIEGRTERIDAFNRTYGLCRGMVAGALLTALLILLMSGFVAWPMAMLVFGVLAVPLYIRMRRFSALYFSELVLQYLALKHPRNSQ
jgi:hypothetical protein